MSNIAYKRIENPKSLVFGQRFTHKGRSGVIGTQLLNKDGTVAAADFQPDSGGPVERIVFPAQQKTQAVPARRTAPSKSGEALADQVFAAVSKYVDQACDRRFADVIKFLPSGSDFERRVIEEITVEVSKLLERHQNTIKSDVEELGSLSTRFDALEARIELLEARKT